MGDKSVIHKTGHVVATIDGTVVAETDNYYEVEGNAYFPPDTIKRSFFNSTSLSTFCPWKGDASYYTIDVNGKTFDNAAWYYKEPYEKCEEIRDYVAFYKNKVDVVVN